MANLGGARVALLESRMGNELAGLVRRHGGEPVCASAVREHALQAGDQVATFVSNLQAGAYSIIVFYTGVGVKALFAEAEKLGRLDDLIAALRTVTTVSRGPKPIAVLKRYDIPVSIRAPEPNTTVELLEAMAGLDVEGKNIAVVNYGERNATFAEKMRACGARIEELCLYEWQLPEDVTPLQALIRETLAERVDAMVFTSQVQVRHLFQVAAEMSGADALARTMNEKLIVASIGPTCTAGLERVGVTPDVVPEHPKMGHLITALARHVEGNP